MQPLLNHTRKTVALPDEMWAAIASYRHSKMIAAEVDAVRRLIEAGLRAEAKEDGRREKGANNA